VSECVTNSNGAASTLRLPVNHALFCVMDGHGGEFASDYASKHLLSILYQQKSFLDYVKQVETCNKGIESDDNKQLNEKLQNLLEVSLENAFIDLDFSLLQAEQNRKLKQKTTKSSFFSFQKKDIEEGKELETDSAGDSNAAFSGTTAVVVLVTPHFIICANLGDSRAVLHITDNPNNPESPLTSKTIALSVDHKPNVPEERERIESRGGTVKKDRVNGELGVSRSLGDYEFKDYSPHNKEETGLLIAHRQRVSPIPEITVNSCCLDHNKFLILACDGIWDVLNNDECVDLIQTSFQERESNLGLICEQVLDVCLKKGSRDNMTIILVRFPGQNYSEDGGSAMARTRQTDENMR